MGKCKKCGADAGMMMSICFDCATEHERQTSKQTPENTPLSERVPCPYCAEQIMRAATICPFCKNPVFSQNKGQNALTRIVISAVLFVIFYFIISAFVKHQAETEYDRIMDKATRDTQKLMREIGR